MGFSAIFFTLNKKSESKSNNWVYPLLVLLGFGIIDILFKKVAVFKEFSFIVYLKSKKGTLSFPLWEHLVFLLTASKRLEAKKICPICKINKVKYFYLLSKSVIAEKYTCCDNPNCRTTMRSRYHIEREFRIDFESLTTLPRKSLMNHAGRLFKVIYGLPRELKNDTAFNLFKEVAVSIDKDGQLNLSI